MVLRSLLLIAFLITASCGGDSATPETQAAASTETAPSRRGDPLEITPAANLLAQLKIAEPVREQVGASFTVAARVEVDETRVTRVGSPVLGRVSTLSVREGEEVTRGQVLLTLNSSGLSEAQLALLKATTQRQLAQRAVERAKTLLDAGVIGSAEMQRREAELREAEAEFDAAKDQLALLGMPPESIEELLRNRRMNSVARVLASMDGIVMDRKVTLGQVVSPADTMFEIANLKQLWLVADVPEQAGGRLVEGQSVEATVSALPNLRIHGKLTFVSHTVNPETRTIRVRMDLANPKKLFKPDMLATMTLKEQLEMQTVIPSDAVVRDGDGDHLFIALDEDTFRLRPVKLGEEYDGKRVLLEGVNPGEKIVVSGSFHLNNERRRRAQRGEGE
jgi:cobalt-zinc-cadmium efflux system membrane fusion protein